jgi:hypothetical protein
MNTKKSEQRAASPVERRQHLRVKLTSPIVGRALGRTDTFVVEEASLGGFSMKSHVAFTPGADYRFRLTNQSGQATIIEVLCRYCNPVEGPEPGRSPSFVVGFQFLPQPTHRLRLIIGAIATDAP